LRCCDGPCCPPLLFQVRRRELAVSCLLLPPNLTMGRRCARLPWRPALNFPIALLSRSPLASGKFGWEGNHFLVRIECSIQYETTRTRSRLRGFAPATCVQRVHGAGQSAGPH